MDQKMILGIDYGATELKMGLVNLSGTVSDVKKYSSGSDAVKTLENSLNDYLSGCGTVPSAIGMGLVGTMDTKNGIWIHSLNMNIRRPVPISAILEERFGIPVIIDNDVHAATIAEQYFGAGRITGDFILLNVGTGISAGIVSNGRLIRGVGNAAGEIGHMCVEYDGAPCSCGHRGCLENIAGGKSLTEAARSIAEDHPDSVIARIPYHKIVATDIFKAASTGDSAALSVADRAVQALGIGIVNLVNTLNPEHIVVTGSVMRSEWLFAKLHDYVYENAYITSVRNLVGFSRFQVKHLGICGAASLCMEF